MENQQTEQQQQALTPQLVSQLVTLFKQPKIQVKYGCLNAILQYTKSQQSKKLFVDTDLFAQMNKVLNNEKLTKLCLSTLINFSSIVQLERQFVRFIEPLIFNLKEWKDDLREELTLLFLLNATKFEAVVHELINYNEKKGFLLEVLYGFMEIKPVRRWVIMNIFVNVSSVELGRKHCAEEKIYVRFLNFINDEKEAIRLGVLKLIRNVSFEWETEEVIVQIFKPQHDLINKLAQHLAYIIAAGNLSTQTSQTDFKKIIFDYQPIEKQSEKIIKTMKVPSKQKALAQICLVIDIFLILSNAGFVDRKVPIKQAPLRELLSILRFTGLSQEYKDKLDALEMFCFV